MVDASALADLDPFQLMDVESERLLRFFEGLDDEGWHRPTRAEGWRVREMCAHLVGVETYNIASLDGTLDELFARASEAGADGLDDFNDWQVGLYADAPPAELLATFRRLNEDWRRRVREVGREGTLQTSVGPYPAGLQAFHLASEYATHADDLGAPVDRSEEPGRTTWRARFSRLAVEEAEKPAEIVEERGTNLVRVAGTEVRLTDAELVEAVSARLPDDHPLPTELREALRALA